MPGAREKDKEVKIKTVSNLWVKGAGLITAGLLFAGAAQAEPVLQVDIDGGSYSSTLADVVTSNPTFTVLALCSPGGQTTSADCNSGADYYLSIALTSDSTIPSTPADYGSIDITVDGVTTTINITADMVYGTPPVDEFTQAHDPGDLPTHSVFPTWFTDVLVSFNDDDKCGAAQYNVQDDPGNCVRTSRNSHYVEIAVDATNLAAGFGLHFDLYDEVLLSNQSGAANDVDQEGFAPPSHDASYLCCERKVAEPGTLGLLGIGLLGLGLARRRKSAV